MDITQRSLKWAREQAITVLILDTAGRLHIDDDLMREVATIRERTQPQEVLLVVDAMTGQDAVRVADEFNKQVGLTGLILTKMDGDARGGAALSVREVTGVPIKFLGTGEKTRRAGAVLSRPPGDAHPGHGRRDDTHRKGARAVRRRRRRQDAEEDGDGAFDLEDFLNQMRRSRRWGR